MNEPPRVADWTVGGLAQEVAELLVVDFDHGSVHLVVVVRLALGHLGKQHLKRAHVDAGVQLVALHCVRLPRPRLSVRENARVVPVHCGLHERRHLSEHL